MPISARDEHVDGKSGRSTDASRTKTEEPSARVSACPGIGRSAVGIPNGTSKQAAKKQAQRSTPLIGWVSTVRERLPYKGSIPPPVSPSALLYFKTARRPDSPIQAPPWPRRTPSGKLSCLLTSTRSSGRRARSAREQVNTISSIL